MSYDAVPLLVDVKLRNQDQTFCGPTKPKSVVELADDLKNPLRLTSQQAVTEARKLLNGETIFVDRDIVGRLDRIIFSYKSIHEYYNEYELAQNERRNQMMTEAKQMSDLLDRAISTNDAALALDFCKLFKEKNHVLLAQPFA